MKIRLQTSLFYGVIIMTFVFMVILNHLTPYAMDDLHMWNHFVTGKPLKSIGDVVESQWFGYFDHTGRVVSHFLWQASCFLFADNKLPLDMLNSAVFAIMTVLIYVHIRGNMKEPDVVLLLFILVCLFSFVEGFGQTFLWIAGSFTYMWMVALVLLFLLPYRIGKGNVVVMFVFGLLAGCSVENLSVGCSVMLCIYLYYKRKVLHSWELTGVIGFWIGTVILLAAPGNYVRMDNVGESISLLSILKNTVALTKIFLNKDCLGVLCLIGGLLYALQRKNFKTECNINLYVYVILTILSVYSLAGVSFYPERSRMVSVVFAIISCGMLLPKNKMRSCRSVLIFAAILALILMPSLRDALRACYKVKDYYEYVDGEICKAKLKGSDVAIIRGYVGDSRFCIFGKYAIFSTDPKAWTNADYARYRGIDKVIVDEEKVHQYSE